MVSPGCKNRGPTSALSLLLRDGVVFLALPPNCSSSPMRSQGCCEQTRSPSPLFLDLLLSHSHRQRFHMFLPPAEGTGSYDGHLTFWRAQTMRHLGCSPRPIDYQSPGRYRARYGNSVRRPEDRFEPPCYLVTSP